MPLIMKLGDWVPANRAGGVGRQLLRFGILVALAGGLLARVYRNYDERTPLLLVVAISFAPAVVVAAAGLFLISRNGTYRGPGRVRWWNWLLWWGT